MSALSEEDERHDSGVSLGVVHLSAACCSYVPLFILNDEGSVNELFQGAQCSTI